jgi:hypothetical protein
MTRIIDDIAKREEFALSCDGKGVLCALTDATPSSDPASADQRQEPRQHRERQSFGNRFMQPGMYVAAINPATGAIRAGMIKVTATNEAGADFAGDAAPNAAWAQNDYLVQAANSSRDRPARHVVRKGVLGSARR